MSNESSRDRGVSVTLKGGRDFDAPWIVFSGTVDSIREDIISAFGFNAKDDDGNEVSNAPDLDLHDLAVEAARAFTAQYGAAQTLGGKPVGRGRSGGNRRSTSSSSQGSESGSAWDQAAAEQQPAAEAAPEEPQGPDLPALIEGCASVADLKNLWADHTDALQGDADLLAKWKARGRALRDAA